MAFSLTAFKQSPDRPDIDTKRANDYLYRSTKKMSDNCTVLCKYTVFSADNITRVKYSASPQRLKPRLSGCMSDVRGNR